MSTQKNSKLTKDYAKIINAKDRVKKKASRVRISLAKSPNIVSSYHPLKQRTAKLHRLKFITCNTCSGASIRKKTQPKQELHNGNWSTINDAIRWLVSIGVQIKALSSQTYMLKDKVCSVNSVIVFANKKRTEAGLEPFYIIGLTEF